MRELTEVEQRLTYRFAHLPLPDDAIDCDPWEWRGHDDWRRYFLTREWDVAGVWVSVAGEQNHLGEITRWMHVGGGGELTSCEAHRVVAALREAATLFDTLSTVDPARSR